VTEYFVAGGEDCLFIKEMGFSMIELHRGDELLLEITDAASEELEACNCNTRSVFLFKRIQC
jgi:hypothetical protein